MIEHVHFENFKALRNVAMDLAPFSLIVGPNASGKTSILEALDCLARVGSTAPQNIFTGSRDPRVLRSSGAEAPMILMMRGVWDGVRGSIDAGASFKPSGGGWAFIARGSAEGAEPVDLASKAAPAPDALRRIIAATRSTAFLRFDPRRMAEPSYSADPRPRVEFDGGNLAATLADLALTEPNGLQELLDRVRNVVGIVDSVSLGRVSIEKTDYVQSKENAGIYSQSRHTYQGFELRLLLKGGGQVPAHAVSEGTLITLGLLTVLSRKPAPHLVMIDELERGLHPKALGELVRQIRALMKQFPSLQVIGATHSPYLVDHFSANEVRITTLSEDGSVLVGKLDEHPDFDRWKDEMKPGEFWSTVGEDWLRERKAPAGE